MQLSAQHTLHTERWSWLFTGVPNLWDLMPDDLRWKWCNNNTNKVHNKYNSSESSPNCPHLQSMRKLPSMKLVPGAKQFGDLRAISVFCQYWCLVFFLSSSSDAERVKGPGSAVPPHRTPRCVVPQGLLRESDHHGSRFYFTARFIGLLKILDLPCCSGCENLNTFSWARYCTVELTQPFSLLFSWTSYCPFLNNLAYWAVRIDGRLAGTGCRVRRLQDTRELDEGRPQNHTAATQGSSQNEMEAKCAMICVSLLKTSKCQR